ncbi:MAG TPA: hypothetical protein VNG90_00090 [Candidatus Acidoferrum sp.]|nr:hypothetical protein [Candidatus Acidoferrum sp.]
MYVISENLIGSTADARAVESLAEQLRAVPQKVTELAIVRGSVPEIVFSDEPTVLLEQMLELQKRLAFYCEVS